MRMTRLLRLAMRVSLDGWSVSTDDLHVVRSISVLRFGSDPSRVAVMRARGRNGPPPRPSIPGRQQLPIAAYVWTTTQGRNSYSRYAERFEKGTTASGFSREEEDMHCIPPLRRGRSTSGDPTTFPQRFAGTAVICFPPRAAKRTGVWSGKRRRSLEPWPVGL